MKESIRVLGLSLTLIVGLGLVSCSDDDNGTIVVPGPTPTPADPEFLVRAVHASPDAPEVDVFANDILAFPGLTFFEVSPDATGTYVPFPAGSVDVDVTLPTGEFVIGESFFIPENTNQTIVVTGTLTAPFGAEPLDIIAFEDDVTTTPGFAEIRILHLSPDAPPVDVRLPDGTPLVEDLVFGNASPQIPVVPGTYTVGVFSAGTETEVFTATLTVTENNFTVYAVGLIGDASFTLEVSQDN